MQTHVFLAAFAVFYNVQGRPHWIDAEWRPKKTQKT
jgi:hypothetical protein